MTPQETDDDLTTLERFHEWRKARPDVTNERLLLSRGLWAVFLALAAWVGFRQIQLDNRVTRERVDDALVREVEDCEERNDRRMEARQVALGDVEADQSALDSDLATWQAIDDLFDAGIPEPARTTVFAGLGARQIAIQTQRELIDTTFEQVSCPDPSVDITDD